MQIYLAFVSFYYFFYTFVMVGWGNLLIFFGCCNGERVAGLGVKGYGSRGRGGVQGFS